MKKLTVAVLCIVLAAATALPVFAAEHVVCRINEIETSFDISTKWDYVTRSHITESFARSHNMTVARVAEYLDDLGMYLWLYAEKGDYELEVNSAPDERGGALDYATMSEADFSAERVESIGGGEPQIRGVVAVNQVVGKLVVLGVGDAAGIA